MTWEVALVAGGVSFVTAILGQTVLIRVLRSRGIVDVPNERSSHDHPVPHVGGIGLLAGSFAGLWVATTAFASAVSWPVIGLACVVAGVGLLDDISGRVACGFRFAAQTAAALCVVSITGPLSHFPLPHPADFALGAAAVPVTVIWIVGVTNIYNFLDGIDGFAGVQALVAGSILAIVCGSGPVGIVGLTIACGAAGFLLFNWQPAKIFMGDVGATALGFLFASLPLAAAAPSRSSLVWLMALSLWFFLSDGAFTILSRAARGEIIWQAHRSHLYQRLVQVGWSHRRVVSRVAPAMAIVSGSALFALHAKAVGAEWMTTGIAFASFLAYWRIVVHAERSQQRQLIVVTGTS